MRIAFDLDGVLADFAGAYGAIARRLSPRPPGSVLDLSEAQSPSDPTAPGVARGVWREIQTTENFWTTLDPIEPSLVADIHQGAFRYGWDTFFVTQRPATAGDTAQRQTQRWLVEQGFALPAVIVHQASRGQLAAALELDFLVDDTVEHCVAVLDFSRATPILVQGKHDAAIETNAQRLGIATCRSGSEALALIVRQQSRRKARRSPLRRPAPPGNAR